MGLENQFFAALAGRERLLRCTDIRQDMYYTAL